ncbi:hypothetical protein BDV11DRAFT_73241 [Aspergillus similis]
MLTLAVLVHALMYVCVCSKHASLHRRMEWRDGRPGSAIFIHLIAVTSGKSRWGMAMMSPGAEIDIYKTKRLPDKVLAIDSQADSINFYISLSIPFSADQLVLETN